MNRIPEPELMEGEAQARAYAEADFTEPHNHFIDALLERIPAGERHRTVLDLGCGPADITLRYAQRIPDNEIHAVDGSAAMLQHAAKAITARQLDARINLYQQLVPDLDLPYHSYDLIISNSLLHHLHSPACLWTTIKSCCHDQTRIFIMDLMRPDTEAAAASLVEHYAAGEPEILQQDFYNSLCAAFTPMEVNKQLHETGLGHLLIEILSDRHLCVSGQHHSH
ncbi:MAG: class I SAM-dependent methyltransferase [Thiotrichales bacterium]|nr:class I SAM-dependent methyltransferase [Thiotrichales bacterium]